MYGPIPSRTPSAAQLPDREDACDCDYTSARNQDSPTRHAHGRRRLSRYAITGQARKQLVRRTAALVLPRVRKRPLAQHLRMLQQHNHDYMPRCI